MASAVTDRQQEPRCELCNAGLKPHQGTHWVDWYDKETKECTGIDAVPCPRSTAKEEGER